MLYIIRICFGAPPQDIDDLIYGDTVTVPSDRLCPAKQK